MAGLQPLATDESTTEQATATPTLPSLTQPQQPTPTDKPYNYNTDIIPQQYIDLEKRLQAGSNTSPLQTILAWVGAAKGDFRGLQAIDEAKRQTALGKALAPEMRKISELVNQGKFKEASDYTNTVSGAVGPRAKEFVPFLNSVAENIRTKEAHYITVKNMIKAYDEFTPKEGHPARPVIDALKKSVDSGEILEPTGVNALLLRAQGHVQQLGDSRLVNYNPLTGESSTTQFPALVGAGETTDFVGNSLAAMHNMNTSQLGDVLRDVAVKTPDGTLIAPNSVQSQTIKTQYNALQPVKAQLELLKGMGVAPADILQLVKTSPAFDKVRQIVGGESAIETMIKEGLKRQEQSQIAIELGKVGGNPLAPQGYGLIAIGVNPTKPESFMVPHTMSWNDVKASNGDFDFVQKDVHNSELKPAYAGIQALQLIPQLLAEGDLDNKRVSAGLNQAISSAIGFPISQDVETRQAAKAILAQAVNQVARITGLDKDSKEIGDMRKFAAGDFKTPQEMIAAAQYFQTNLEMVIQRAVKLKSPLNSYSTVEPTSTQPAQPKSPAQKIAPLIPQPNTGPNKAKITVGPLSPELDRKMQEAEQEALKQRRGVQTPPQPRQAEPAPQPTQTQAPSAADRIKAARELKYKKAQ